MATYPSLRAHAVETCERAGYAVTESTDPGDPPVLATAEAEEDPLFGGPVRPVAVECLDERDCSPSALVLGLADAVARGRRCLFVVPADDDGDPGRLARYAARVFQPPAFLAARDDDGARTFYNGPDRVHLAEGGLAATTGDPTTATWQELEPEPDPERTGADVRPVELAVEGRRVTELASVRDLDCPPRAAFRYWYERDPESKRFQVHDRGGVVATVGGVAEMRRAGYHPVPMPVVPEQSFAWDDRGIDPRRSWGVTAPGTDVVQTADGDRAFGVVGA
jgi:hypothetical protein